MLHFMILLFVYLLKGSIDLTLGGGYLLEGSIDLTLGKWVPPEKLQPKKPRSLFHIICRLFTKLLRSIWLDIMFVFFST